MKGEYTGGIKVTQGTIKVGETLTFTDDDGNANSFKILSLEDYDLDQKVNSLTNKTGFIVMQTLDQKKLTKLSGGLEVGRETSKSNTSGKAEDVATTCTFDNKTWKGKNYYKSSTYFPKGNEMLSTKGPLLLISFKAALGKDDRQLTITIRKFKPQVGIVNRDNLEFLLSGSEDGVPNHSCLISNIVNSKASSKSGDLSFEITKYEDKGSYIILSAKYGGKIYGLNLLEGLVGKMCHDVVVKNGEIVDLRVDKY
jgi:hypothetical protein